MRKLRKTAAWPRPQGAKNGNFCHVYCHEILSPEHDNYWGWIGLRFASLRFDANLGLSEGTSVPTSEKEPDSTTDSRALQVVVRLRLARSLLDDVVAALKLLDVEVVDMRAENEKVHFVLLPVSDLKGRDRTIQRLREKLVELGVEP